jgi:hypothetical protein
VNNTKKTVSSSQFISKQKIHVGFPLIVIYIYILISINLSIEYTFSQEKEDEYFYNKNHHNLPIPGDFIS